MKSMNELIHQDNALVVDVRTQSEYNLEHYPGAMNIPLDELPKHLKELQAQTRPMILYCRSGNRSSIGLNFLQQQGLKNVYNGGGLSDMLFAINKN